MNETTYVYIVHSDINENNIYAEFATEEEAIDYARRNKDELTYVDKVEVALDEDGDIIEMFDSETIWVYDEEDDFELEEEINEFDLDFEDERPLIDTRKRTNPWAKPLDYVSKEDLYRLDVFIKKVRKNGANKLTKDSVIKFGNKRVLTAGLADCNSLEDVENKLEPYFDYLPKSIYNPGIEAYDEIVSELPKALWELKTGISVDDEGLDESFLESEHPLDEGINLRNDAEREEFFRLCDEIGIYSAKDLINFKKEVDCTDENILQALRDYRAELGPDFKIANPELERELAMKYEGIDFDKLVEELEEFEDEVECKECYGLFPKESCHRNEAGKYVCEKCNNALTEETIESDQELEGTDNAVVDCEVADIITHSEDEKPLDCEMKKAPLEKPLTEEVAAVLTEKEFTQMETYLKSGKYRSLDTEWTDEGDADRHFAIDEVGAYLDYNPRINMFTLGLSIYHASEDNNAEYPERHTDEDEFSYDSLAEMYEDEDCTEILNRLYKDNLAKITKALSEETHAQYAKPEGNRVQAYNNALKYAKKNNCNYIYGYTNHAGKFFALEQPIKAKDFDAEEQFRKQYKNCNVVYMVYPDKAFLKESLYNFTPEEMEEYGCDEEGCSLEGWDTFVRCNWCKEVYTEYDCAFEANLGWLCDRCQEELRSHGGPLTIVEEPTEEQIKATLEEAIKMTRDELLDKEGTTDVELINAGRPEEERVELVEE